MPAQNATSIPTMIEPAAIDSADLRKVFGRFATGVTVVTTGGHDPHGMTANSFTTVSLSPALVLVCIKRTSTAADAVARQGCFAVSVLGANQREVALYFANRRRPRDRRQFAFVDFRTGTQTGAPILAGAASWLECRVADMHSGGDHTIFVAEVLACGSNVDDETLVFHDSTFKSSG